MSATPNYGGKIIVISRAEYDQDVAVLLVARDSFKFSFKLLQPTIILQAKALKKARF